MPRTAPLIPTLIESRKAQGKAPWCLSIPSHLSSTGERQRLFYATKQAALLQAQTLQARCDNFGLSLTSMTPARIAEAAEAYNMLEGTKLRLLDVVRTGMATHKTQSESVPFLDLFNQFLDSKATRDPVYLKELRITRDRFPQLHQVLVSDITARKLEQILKGLNGGARNAVMRYLRAVFNYGLKRKYLAENPIGRLDFAHRPRREVEIIPNGQVIKMLNHALIDDLALLPYLVLGFFCGIRPDGELQEMVWSDIDLTDRIVVIRSEASKTRRRRFPDLSENAKSWLLAYQARGGSRIGKIVTYNESELRTHRTKNWKVSGMVKWIPQGMRHTYCSNWLAVHKDVNKLVLQSGHDSVDTMWRHYHRGSPEADALAFWAITPPETEDKIIRLPAQR
jgi:integrase